MTTGADIVAVAEQVRAAGEVYRTNGDWSGLVSVQDSGPWAGMYGGMHVEHCGISVGYILWRAGLVMGRDFPNTAYSPTLCQALLAGGYDQTPQPGCIGVIDWGLGGYGDCGDSDHVVLIVEDHGDTLVTLEANTTADGCLYYYERGRGLFTAFGMPSVDTATPTPQTPPQTPAQPARRPFLLPTIEDDEMLIIRVPDRAPLGFAGGVLFAIGDASVGGSGVKEVSMSPGVFMEFYRAYCRTHRLNPLSGEPLPA